MKPGAGQIAKSANVAAIGSSTGLISIVNAVTGATTEVLNAPASRPIGEIGFSPDGKHIAFTYGDETGPGFDIFKVDLETHREAVIRTQAKSRQLALAVSDDGRLVGSSGAFDRAIAIDAPEQSDRQSSNSFRLRGRTKPVYAVAYDPFGARLGWGYTDAGSHNSQKEPLEFTLQLPLDNAPLGNPEQLTSGAESYRRAVAARGALSMAAVKGGSLEQLPPDADHSL